MSMQMSGKSLTRLMRKHKVSSRALADRTGITLSRIRECRKIGVPMPACLDWEEAIIGEFSPRMRAMLEQWRAERWPE